MICSAVEFSLRRFMLMVYSTKSSKRFSHTSSAH